MGCKELSIESYYRFSEPGEKSYMRPSDCEEKTAYIAIFCEAIVDGYNLIASFDGDTGDLLKSWTWGEAGLISEIDHVEGKTYLATADGNRNITAYIDASDGSIAAEYEYDPGGREIVRSGPKTDDFTFRFASYQYDKETGLVYMVMRYYDPETGRFLSRDPIGIAGGSNPYRYTKNDTINMWDVLGMWGSDVHYIRTKWWGESVFTRKAAAAIADADEGVDSEFGGRSYLPSYLLGDQSYHFNTAGAGAKDSRLKHFNDHMKKAKEACSDKPFSDEPEDAAMYIGIALHPKQDYYAHGDYGKFIVNNWHGNLVHHNKYAPGYSLLAGFGDASSYPDDPRLDAFGSTTGRPDSSEGAQGGTGTWLGMKFVWYHYKMGNKRISKTKSETLKALKDFRTHLKKQKTCCKCLDYFIGNGTTIPNPK